MSEFIVKDGLFYVNNEPVFLSIAEFQYFRIDKKLWKDSITRLKSAGFNTLSTYVPWIWHELNEGEFDFEGKTNPKRDVLGFIDICKDNGLWLIIKPGPFIYAEYLGLGNPLWLGKHYPETVAKDSALRLIKGDFYYIYSLLHPVYLSFVKRWYEQLIHNIRTYIQEPIISIQLDNETGLMYYNRIGELDFNPHTVDRYREFLIHKYENNIKLLNNVWATNYLNFDEIFPPKKPFTSNAELIDWQVFFEEFISAYLQKLKSIITELGVSIPISINEPATYLSPSNPERKSNLSDIYGYDLYIKCRAGEHTADFPFANSQYPALFDTYSKPLVALELGNGWLDNRVDVSNEATLHTIMASIAHGVKGMCVYPAHDGVEETGEIYSFSAMIDHLGNITQRYDVVVKILDFIKRNAHELIHSTKVYDSIGILTYFPNFRFILDDYLPFQVFPDPVKYMAFLGHYGIYALLVSYGFTPKIISLEKATIEELAKFKVLFFPNKGFVDDCSFRKLQDYVKAGGNLITYPVVPSKDMCNKELPVSDIYPVREMMKRWFGNTRLLSALIWHFVLKYNIYIRGKLKNINRYCMHICDTFEPLLIAQNTPLKGILIDTRSGDKIRADYCLNMYDCDEPILSYQGTPVGYKVKAGEGTSTVIGTILGGCYLTVNYYSLSQDIRDGLRRFITKLMNDCNVVCDVYTDEKLEVEIIRRRIKDGYIVFIINRLYRQKGMIMGIHGKIYNVFSYKDSNVEYIQDGMLSVDIDKDDIIAFFVRE